MWNGILVYSQLFQFVIYTTRVIACMGVPRLCLGLVQLGDLARPWSFSATEAVSLVLEEPLHTILLKLGCFDFGKHECAGFQHLPGQFFRILLWCLEGHIMLFDVVVIIGLEYDECSRGAVWRSRSIEALIWPCEKRGSLCWKVFEIVCAKPTRNWASFCFLVLITVLSLHLMLPWNHPVSVLRW